MSLHHLLLIPSPFKSPHVAHAFFGEQALNRSFGSSLLLLEKIGQPYSVVKFAKIIKREINGCPHFLTRWTRIYYLRVK
jgi:hypothetical protein